MDQTAETGVILASDKLPSVLENLKGETANFLNTVRDKAIEEKQTARYDPAITGLLNFVEVIPAGTNQKLKGKHSTPLFRKMGMKVVGQDGETMILHGNNGKAEEKPQRYEFFAQCEGENIDIQIFPYDRDAYSNPKYNGLPPDEVRRIISNNGRSAEQVNEIVDSHRKLPNIVVSTDKAFLELYFSGDQVEIKLGRKSDKDGKKVLTSSLFPTKTLSLFNGIEAIDPSSEQFANRLHNLGRDLYKNWSSS